MKSTIKPSSFILNTAPNFCFDSLAARSSPRKNHRQAILYKTSK